MIGWRIKPLFYIIAIQLRIRAILVCGTNVFRDTCTRELISNLLVREMLVSLGIDIRYSGNDNQDDNQYDYPHHILLLHATIVSW